MEERQMQQDNLIIDVLFPAILLMMINCGNHYSLPENVIRHFHNEVIRDSVSAKNTEWFLLQISRLRDRLWLTGIIQPRSAISLVLALGAMITAYFNEPVITSILFLVAILLMIGLMLLFTLEIQIANRVLDVHLSNFETHKEWKQYLKPKHRRRAATKT